VTDQPGGGWRRPDRRLLVLRRRLVLGFVTLPGVVVSTGASALVDPVASIAGLLVTCLLTAELLLAVQRRYLAWGYLEREDDLLVRRGVMVRRTSVVPYGRMQYVDVTSGPLARRLGLAMVTLHTAAAATDASIPGLRTSEAARLRDRLAALGEARQAGV
jgi:membrane protein YdbS with pleckstrin-like domain